MLLRVTALIVDDERPAREEMCYLLEKYTDIEVVGKAGSALEAIHIISLLQPTIVFLDISMPGTTGSELLKELPESQSVVFVTAHDDFAVTAYEDGAADYLLKPVTPERLQKCVQRIKTNISATQKKAHPLFIKEKDSFHLASYDDIKFIESYGNYVRIHFSKKVRVVSMTMSAILETLDNKRFIQINRKHIINFDFVKTLTEKEGRQIEFCLKDDSRFTCSSRRSAVIRNALQANDSLYKFLK